MHLGRWSRRARESRVQLIDADPSPEPDPGPALLRIAAEAVILQDRAEEVLAAVGRREPLGWVAPRAGPLVRRFFALREELPPVRADAALLRLRETLDTILHHHAMQVATALEFLAVDWRSDRLAQQVATITGLGAPARVLDDVYAQLRVRQAPQVA